MHGHAAVNTASSGIGAVYARRLAARGHDLVLVARATDRLNALATELRNAHGVVIEVITADLIDTTQLEPLLLRMRSDPPIDILVNNAGAALIGDFATADYDRAGGNISKVPDVMEVDVLVDAALVGFDRKELVTIPPVPDVAAWEAF